MRYILQTNASGDLQLLKECDNLNTRPITEDDPAYQEWLGKGNVAEVLSYDPPVGPSLEEARTARCLDVERERDRRIYGGFPVVFPDGQARIQSRGEQDWTNIAGIGMSGLEAIVSGMSPDAVIPGLGFKDEANAWHPLTPIQAVDFGKQCKGYRAAVYAASWEHKRVIGELPDPEAVAAYDITTLYWPEA